MTKEREFFNINIKNEDLEETESLYNLSLTEFEILSLREGMFKCLRDDTISQKELNKIDDKIKEVIKNDC